MNVIKCDRCGEICHYGRTSTIVYTDGDCTVSINERKMDLCPKCNKEFKNWKAKI